ncbi:hypothetical protein DPMN_161872 [Dreissena polymorpha]|uniref:Uncharacterized protein n=1 Tax=Dreissena polymorpha TaxID=45954 RepID=A0A9D4IT40_DREPO|nr:hypothetical protein DPMN_161872 [Dreissena polymorpha]
MADYELKENEYDHIADIDLYTNKNDVNADVTRARHLSNRELPPLPGATSSTDDDYLIPMTATLTMDISLTLNTKDKLLRQTIHT